MIDEQQAITDLVELVLGVVGDRGSILRWDEIESTTGMTRYVAPWSTVLKKVRKRLLRDRNQAVWPETNVGLRLLTESETVRICPEKRQRRMYRQAGKAIQELASADPSKLSTRERILQESQIQNLEAERKKIRASVKEVVKSSESLPRVPVS